MRPPTWTRLVAIALAAGACSALVAGVVLEPKAAPEWKVSEWINGDPGPLSRQRGKVVLIDFIQLWCPGCNEFSIPLFEKWQGLFGTRDDVVILSIHTVFEGHDVQTPERLRAFVAERGITHPVGIDAYATPGARLPVTMERYDTGGTPHVAVIDRDGLLRFTHFGRFDPEPVERFITRLLDERPDANVKSVPYEERKAQLAREGGGRKNARQRGSPEAEPERPPPPPPPEAELSPDAVDPQPGEPDDPALAEGGELPSAPEEAERAPDGDGPDPSLSGSFRLRFEQVSNSCGDLGQPVEVITQVVVSPDRIVAKFSRPYLGLRELSTGFNSGSSDFSADVRQRAQDADGTGVEVALQVSGQFVSIVDPVALEFRFTLDKRGAEPGQDCLIEGQGSGSRLRPR